ncbi:MAG TPA: F0F1 ATP synthase subunit A [Ktedonobacteraceae bacterium]
MFWKLPKIIIQPDVIFSIGNFPVTNTLLCTWLVIALLLLLVFFARRKPDRVPRGFQNFSEWAVESLLNLVEGVSGKEKGRKFFPLVATLFIFILFANLVDILPGVDTIGSFTSESLKLNPVVNPINLGFLHLLSGNDTGAIVPWFRPPTTDLNLTFSMALIVVVVCQVFGFATLGAGEHLSKYFKFKELVTKPSGSIEFFVGLVELVTELSRILSFAFRLFGNIFAGSAVLAVFGFLTLGIGNVVFIPLELFVAFVQALVFSLLTLVFLEMATASHSHEEHEEEELAEVEHEAARQKLAASH